MRVEDDGTRHQAWERSDRGLRKESEPASIIRIVDGVLSVDPRAVEIVEMLDEEDLGTASRARYPKYPCLLRVRAHGHHERLADGLEIGIGVSHRAVERKDG